MNGVNKVILIGHLGKDPEAKYLPDGKAVCNVSLATSESWKDKQSGEKKERTEWHALTFYGRQAEVVCEYCQTGSVIYVEGSLKTRNWEKDGVKHYKTEVQVSNLQLLGGPGKPTKQAEERMKPKEEELKGGDPFSDEIPFGPYERNSIC